ncbi:MAG: hypothetical protein KDD33_04395, partial [Bdellovibrionales bacterium]|nr:hypothetical protein [Bdellovibrionales bacterium]
MLRFILTIVMTFCFASQGFAFDPNQEDKQKHMAASTVISMPTYLTMRSQNYSRFESASVAILLTLLVGHAKETSDKRYDANDM